MPNMMLTDAEGGHSHIRDFTVYDDASVAIESGKSGPQGLTKIK